MSLETYTGSSLPELFAQARSQMGADAVLLSVRKVDSPGGSFELIAADPTTAEAWKKKPTPVSFPKLPPDLAKLSGGGRPYLVALVGPTGSGKTTTIAKLAKHDSAFAQHRVGLINLDTYRVGAVEQLEIYAKLFRLPLELIYGTEEIPNALHRLRDREVILVDTPGRGPREQEDAAVIHEYLRRLRPDEVHLTLPTSISPDLARELIVRARPHGLTHLLPTKLDEFPENVIPFALAEETQLSIRWVGDGQRVPRDLKTAQEDGGVWSAPAETVSMKA